MARGGIGSAVAALPGEWRRGGHSLVAVCWPVVHFRGLTSAWRLFRGDLWAIWNESEYGHSDEMIRCRPVQEQAQILVGQRRGTKTQRMVKLSNEAGRTGSISTAGDRRQCSGLFENVP